MPSSAPAFPISSGRAQSGGLASWESRRRGWLALIIALDQLPRNLYRGTAAAFAADPLAQHVARRGFERSLYSSLSVLEQLFCLMPFQHAEDLTLQEEAVRRGDAVLAMAPAEWTALIEDVRELRGERDSWGEGGLPRFFWFSRLGPKASVHYPALRSLPAPQCPARTNVHTGRAGVSGLRQRIVRAGPKTVKENTVQGG